MFEDIIRLVGPNQAVEFFGVRLVGINAENGKKILISIAVIFLTFLLRKLIKVIVRFILRGQRNERIAFWIRQVNLLVTTLILIIVLTSIWFDDPGRLATALGLVTAGLAFALQKVVTAIAGYFVILRGKIFNIGDRIVMGGVRGDVVDLGFTQTTIMEMGQPPSVQNADPAVWIMSRQYTGRLVTVSNARIFDEAVYNYTRDFPFIWEEIHLPISYKSNRKLAEKILLETAKRHTVTIEQISKESLVEMKRRYFIRPSEVWPKVYYGLSDKWLELTVRFIVEDHGIREAKDKMGREILEELDKAGIVVATSSFEIAGLPPIRVNTINNVEKK